MSSQDLSRDIQEGKDELTRLLRQPTLPDILFTIAVRNLKDGKVWMNYQLLKNLFESLRGIAEEFPDKVQTLIRHHSYPDYIDRAMTMLMCFSGLTYLCEVNNDYWYITEEVQLRGMCHYDVMTQEEKEALDRIASLYGKLLEEVGR